MEKRPEPKHLAPVRRLTDSLRPSTLPDVLPPLGAQQPTPAASGAPFASPLDALAAEAEESAERLGFILSYINAPESNPLFGDKTVVYQVVAAERSYQQRLLAIFQAELGALPPPSQAMGLTPEDLAKHPAVAALYARRGELEGKMTEAREVQAQLFGLLKSLTGARGKTGGSGFLSKPAGPAPGSAGQSPLDDALDLLDKL